MSLLECVHRPAERLILALKLLDVSILLPECRQQNSTVVSDPAYARSEGVEVIISPGFHPCAACLDEALLLYEVPVDLVIILPIVREASIVSLCTDRHRARPRLAECLKSYRGRLRSVIERRVRARNLVSKRCIPG